MSIANVANVALNSLLNNTPATQNNAGPFQGVQRQFQQLGQDLQAGNLTQAQEDYATLSQYLPGGSQSTSTATNSPIAQAFNNLAKLLQQGNLPGAQQEYTTIQQDLQQQGPQRDFQNLGQALQAGNLTQAQQYFTLLSQYLPGGSQSNNNATNSPIAKAFATLGQDLQNGNLSAAQQDYANIQQDLQGQQQQGGTGQVHHHHHHGGGGGAQQDNGILQAFNSLAQALQGNNLSGAQTAFATLQQDLQQFSANGSFNSLNGTTTGQSQTTGNNLNVTA
jgi:outer membrane protein assembly factor BamD (BamD/ComL family)